MREDFILKIRQDSKLKDVSELGFAQGEVLHVLIPECCREGWDSCPHVPKKFRKTKTNIGL